MRKILPFLLLILLLNFSCQKAEDTTNYCQVIDPYDREMLDLYNQILEERKNEKKFIQNFKMLHVNWVQYRNTLAKTIWYKEPEAYTADYRNCKCELLLELTKARIEELKMWTEGHEKWKSCEGSVK